MNKKRKNAEQQQVITFLCDPHNFNDGSTSIDTVETHGALIFLGRRDVYKIKRAVKYAYMDLSTLEQRKAMCEREFAINRQTAPSIYKCCVPIVRTAHGRLAIGGSGEPVEWVVVMNRFPEADVLSTIASQRGLNPRICADLGSAIARYHSALSPADAGNGAHRIRQVIDELTEAFKGFEQELPEALRQDPGWQMLAQFNALSDLLDRRATRGLVRRCHGDLHLRNIVLIDGVPTPFDALEFDEQLATIDVLYDLAFLIMDLLHQGLRFQANLVFNRYLLSAEHLAQPDGLRALPLFMAMRAGIRAMVSLQTAQTGSGDKHRLVEDAWRYLLEASVYLQPALPRLIVVAGLSGSGKSTLAERLAPKLVPAPGAVHLRSDLERKQLWGVDELERLPAEAYTPEATEKVYAQMMRKADDMLCQGYSVVIDAVFLTAQERHTVAKIAKDADVPFVGLWLEAPEKVLMDRVAARHGDASDADVDIVKLQLSTGREKGMADDPDWISIDASGTKAKTLENALKVPGIIS